MRFAKARRFLEGLEEMPLRARIAGLMEQFGQAEMDIGRRICSQDWKKTCRAGGARRTAGWPKRRMTSQLRSGARRT